MLPVAGVWLLAVAVRRWRGVHKLSPGLSVEVSLIPATQSRGDKHLGTSGDKGIDL